MKHANILTLAILATCAISKAETAAKPEPYELKNKSVCNLTQEMRAPFWPIGWQKPKASEVQPDEPNRAEPRQPVVEAPKFQLSSDSFNVTSILLGHPSIAVINGRSFEEGQYLPVVADDQPLKVQVRAIREQGVWLQLDAQQPILVPMRRVSLQPKASPQLAPQQQWTIQLTKQ